MSTMDSELALRRELGRLSVSLAIEAGRRARELRASGFSIGTKSSSTDLVTEVDRAIEAWITAEITRLRPDDSVTGEEGAGDQRTGAHRTGDERIADDGPGLFPVGPSRVRWLIDPIDGTVNFALGLPHWAVSVAVEVDGRVVAGCVSNPCSGDTFQAVLGAGAYLSHREPSRDAMETDELPLGGPRTISLDRAVVGTGFSYDRIRRAQQGEVAAALLARIGDVRRLGSASLDLCAVAAGWLDAYYEAGLNEWDYSAGLLIATEASCVSSGLGGQTAGTGLCAVAGRDLGPAFFELLAELGAGSPPD
jgi:myo-inositol-1(or 4)-monophosphatase